MTNITAEVLRYGKLYIARKPDRSDISSNSLCGALNESDNAWHLNPAQNDNFKKIN